MIARTVGFLAFSIVTAAAAYRADAAAQAPAAVAAPGDMTAATFQGEGAQVYECKAGKDSKLAWVFREPIATLILNAKTVGRHFAGPSWEDADGSSIIGKVIGTAPGATASDIPWLKLKVVSHRGHGLFTDVRVVQRLDTHGGALQGSCDHAGAFQNVPYSASYVFLRKAK